MLPIEQIEALHKKYAPNDKVYERVYGHCQIVNEIAQWCAKNYKGTVDTDLLRDAALLHDIGTYVFFNSEAEIKGSDLYPLHAILGAKIIADEGLDKKIAKLVETHILLGVSKQEILDHPWPLPARDYIPDTIEGELLCYADRFHSKQPKFNSYETFSARMKERFPIQAERFEAWTKRFGIPDVPKLAEKHQHPIV